MRIIIKDPVSGAETILCDGPGRGLDRNHGPLDGLMIDDQVATQVAEFLRSDTVQAYNRRNQRTAISFRVVRESASAMAAHAWQLAFHAGCLRSGTLHLTETSAQGSTSAIKIGNAVIQSIKTTPMGCSRMIDFNIVGGKLST